MNGGKWDNCNSIINKYIKKKKNEGSGSKLEKNRRRLAGRDAMTISPAEEQLLLSICGNSLEVGRCLVRKEACRRGEIRVSSTHTTQRRAH